MTFTESIQTCFTKYADFKGKASRSEFWWWALFNFIAGICLSIIDQRLSWAFTVATLLPYLAVSTRRLHDVDRSGWWQLIGLVPFVGWIVVIYWLAQEPKPTARFLP